MNLHVRMLLAVGVCVLAAGCNASQLPVQAGGSTFAYPIMSKWCGEYFKAKHVEFRYQPVGSGRGIDDMIEEKFAFGCTDGPMNEKELEKARAKGGEVVHIPLAMGAVAPIYHLEDVKEPLRFSGPVLAEIFLGKIQTWNDPALQELNPGVKLPNRRIHTVHRQDSSGTTYVFTDYLSKVSPEWQTRVGPGKLVQWPVGTAEPGNQKVAAAVKETPDTIAYAELTYGIQDVIQFGLVQNREGEFVKPSPLSVTAAAHEILAKIPDDLRYSITDAPGKDTYPVSGTVWAVLYVKQSGAQGKAVAEFLKWILNEGQSFVTELHYAPLPQPLLERAKKKLEQVKVQ